MIKAVVFDFDGLIMDTESREYEALQEIFKEHESDLPLSVWGKGIGTHSGFDPFTYLEEQIEQKLDRDELRKNWMSRFEESIAKEKALPGVEGYLAAAKELGLKIGLASSSRYDWVSRHLKHIGLFEHFECIKTADDVEKVKPDPALYLEAAACLGVKPEECLAFEDSVNGSMAAKAAGMKCVIVPNSVTKELEFKDFDHRLESMAEMELEALLEAVSQQKG
ncbi:HAD family hydrolase [Metabacillus sp. GX 13764]|uniref:HAD family hydrolase n=1 Tax=Metabacillus kandeliae TaxID=2900151 RepID=UPI001E4C5AAE|nr:HAD family hydrolase [Metabacillus kandeliae]MCD7035199.1 HAD family hydrolase [Metabacillus kandeliae]